MQKRRRRARFSAKKKLWSFTSFYFVEIFFYHGKKYFMSSFQAHNQLWIRRFLMRENELGSPPPLFIGASFFPIEMWMFHIFAKSHRCFHINSLQRRWGIQRFLMNSWTPNITVSFNLGGLFFVGRITGRNFQTEKWYVLFSADVRTVLVLCLNWCSTLK